MHDVFTVGVPLLAILAGIFFNRSDIRELRSEIRGELNGVRGELHSVRGELRSEIRELRGEMNRRFDAVDAELRYFHGITGKLDGRVEAIEKRGS